MQTRRRATLAPMPVRLALASVVLALALQPSRCEALVPTTIAEEQHCANASIVEDEEQQQQQQQQQQLARDQASDRQAEMAMQWLLAPCSPQQVLWARQSLPTPEVIEAGQLDANLWALEVAAPDALVLLTGAGKVNAVLRECLLEQARGLPRGDTISGQPLVDKCGPLHATPVPAQLPRAEREAISLARGGVVEARVAQLGVREAFLVVDGEVQVLVCPAAAAAEVLHPEAGDEGVEFGGQPFRPNFARNPGLRSAKTLCSKVMTKAGQALMVPASAVFTAKSKGLSTVVRFKVVDEIGVRAVAAIAEVGGRLPYNLSAQQLWQMARGPTSALHVPTSALRAPTQSFGDWQLSVRLRALAEETRSREVRLQPMLQARTFLDLRAVLVQPGDALPRSVQIEWRLQDTAAILARAEQVPWPTGLCGLAKAIGQLVLPAEQLVASPTLDGMSAVARLTGLLPATVYQVRARAVSPHFAVPGAWSAWIATSTKSEGLALAPPRPKVGPCSDRRAACAMIHWEPPLDDGGMEITGYSISYWEVESPTRAWVRTAPLSAAQSGFELNNLRPGRRYAVSVAAQNAAGDGAKSEPSEPLLARGATQRVRALHRQRFAQSRRHDDAVLGDWLDYERAVERTLILGEALEPSESKTALEVTLSDALQHVVIHGDSQDPAHDVVSSLPAWASHHSPKMFDVRARLVRSEPADACSPLTNAAKVAGCVVIVQRSKCPLLEKVRNAHAAHAAGVIIVDAGEHCGREFNHHCSPGSAKHNGEGFAKQDQAALWAALHMPTVMVAHKDLEKALKGYS